MNIKNQVISLFSKDNELDNFNKKFFELYKKAGKTAIHQEAFLVIVVCTFFNFSGIPKERKLEIIKQIKIGIEKKQI